MAVAVRKGRTNMIGRKPCETLKLLHKRSGLSGEALAKAMGKGAKTSYFRYEDPGRMRDKPIPWWVIEKLIPVMVGKGDPPITVDELVKISDAKNFNSVGRIALHPAVGGGSGAAPVSRPASELSGAGIPLRYRAERGTWIETELLDTKSYGPSVVAASNEWPVERQFAVMVGDAHAMPNFGPGDVLHCVRGENPTGRQVILCVEKAHMGIAEIVVGTFKAIEGPANIGATLANGSLVVGSILGVVVGAYRRVV